MNDQSVANLVKLYIVVTKMEALKSEREGMLQANRERESAGHSAAYDEYQFANNAEEFRILGNMISEIYK